MQAHREGAEDRAGQRLLFGREPRQRALLAAGDGGITTHLTRINHCKTVSDTNCSNRWIHRIDGPTE